MATVTPRLVEENHAVATPYDNGFFDFHEQLSLESARHIVPIVQGLVGAKSVVDVGCGRGAWLSVFSENGAKQIAGYDGDYVDLSRLLIDHKTFHAVDLTKKFSIQGTHDLAICLEVGEHLPCRMAKNLVQTLCELAPVVIFSAAIPGQGGVHHINEQWPDFWKQLFDRAGYRRFDCIRPLIWQNPQVAWWYQQNVYLFANAAKLAAEPCLAQRLEEVPAPGLEIIAPHVLRPYTTLSSLVKELPRAVLRALKQRLP